MRSIGIAALAAVAFAVAAGLAGEPSEASITANNLVVSNQTASLSPANAPGPGPVLLASGGGPSSASSGTTPGQGHGYGYGRGYGYGYGYGYGGYGYGVPIAETICHHPGQPSEQTLDLPQSSVPRHLAHGDVLGACS